MRRKVKREAVAQEPWLVWNAFVDLIGRERYEALSAAQRPAHLAFWYDSEVQNGGHLQFFLNLAGRRAEETAAAVLALGGGAQAAILREAIGRWQSSDLRRVETLDPVMRARLVREFQDLDRRYASCAPTTQQLLEDYLRKNEPEFIDYGGR